MTFHPEYKAPLVYPGEHIVLEPILARLVDGQLMVEALEGDDVVLQDLYLPVTVDEDANQSWSWRMRFDSVAIGLHGDQVKLPDRRFPIEEGDGPLDLSEVAGEWSGGTLITRGTEGPPPTVEWDGAVLVVGGERSPDLTGQPGSPGAPGAIPTAADYAIVGPGRPDVPSTTGGLVSSSTPVGATYTSTDGAGVGAWQWLRTPTGWTVTMGDTGWRNITAGTPAGLAGEFYIRRVGTTSILVASGISGASAPIHPVIAGFRAASPMRNANVAVLADNSTSVVGQIKVALPASECVAGSLHPVCR